MSGNFDTTNALNRLNALFQKMNNTPEAFKKNIGLSSLKNVAVWLSLYALLAEGEQEKVLQELMQLSKTSKAEEKEIRHLINELSQPHHLMHLVEDYEAAGGTFKISVRSSGLKQQLENMMRQKGYQALASKVKDDAFNEFLKITMQNDRLSFVWQSTDHEYESRTRRQDDQEVTFLTASSEVHSVEFDRIEYQGVPYDVVCLGARQESENSKVYLIKGDEDPAVLQTKYPDIIKTFQKSKRRPEELVKYLQENLSQNPKLKTLYDINGKSGKVVYNVSFPQLLEKISTISQVPGHYQVFNNKSFGDLGSGDIVVDQRRELEYDAKGGKVVNKESAGFPRGGKKDGIYINLTLKDAFLFVYAAPMDKDFYPFYIAQPNEIKNIHQAIAAGNMAIAKSMLEKDSSCLEARNEDGHTPLISAIIKENFQMVDYLIAQGADLFAKTEAPNNQANNGRPVLFWALEKHNYDVRKLLAKKIDDGTDLITYCVSVKSFCNFSNITEYLAKESIEKASRWAVNALQMAIEKVSLECVKDCSAYCAISKYIKQEHWNAELHTAIKLNQDEIVSFLLKEHKYEAIRINGIDDMSNIISCLNQNIIIFSSGKWYSFHADKKNLIELEKGHVQDMKILDKPDDGVIKNIIENLSALHQKLVISWCSLINYAARYYKQDGDSKYIRLLVENKYKHIDWIATEHEAALIEAVLKEGIEDQLRPLISKNELLNALNEAVKKQKTENDEQKQSIKPVQNPLNNNISLSSKEEEKEAEKPVSALSSPSREDTPAIEVKRPQFKIENKSALRDAILEMQNYGALIGGDKGVTVRVLAEQLINKLPELEHIGSKKELDQFQSRFLTVLHSKDNQMKEYRVNWFTIVENILIALTGVGLIAIAFKLSSTGSTGRMLFFGQQQKTTREENRDAVAQSLDKLTLISN